MKREFARILDLPETQVLLTVDESEDAEDKDNVPYKMNVRFDMGEFGFTMGFGFKEEETAIAAMKDFTVDGARKIYDAVKSDFTE